MSNRRKGTSFRNKRDLTLLRCVRNGLAIYSLGQRKEIVPPDSLVVRITAWYGWLLVVLVLIVIILGRVVVAMSRRNAE